MTKEKASMRRFKKDLLHNMQKNAGRLIVNYIAEAPNSYRLERLQRAYYAAGGDGEMLLGKFFPKRVKFLISGKWAEPSYILPIRGAEEFLIVCDCESLKCKIMDAPMAEMLEF